MDIIAELKSGWLQPSGKVDSESVQKIKYNVSTITVRNRSTYQSSFIDSRRNTATLFDKQLTFDQRDEILEYAETYFNKDWYSVTVNIKMQNISSQIQFFSTVHSVTILNYRTQLITSGLSADRKILF